MMTALVILAVLEGVTAVLWLAAALGHQETKRMLLAMQARLDDQHARLDVCEKNAAWSLQLAANAHNAGVLAAVPVSGEKPS